MFMKGKSVKHSVFPTHNGVLSHAAAFLVTVGFVMYTSSERKQENSSELMKTIARFIHLFSFASWVGIQFWIHVSGFTMYKTLKRSDFVAVQSKMFPLYFTAGFITSSVTLLTHLYINPVISWQNNRVAFYQTVAFIVSLACCVLNLTYLGPVTVHLVEIRAARQNVLGIKDGVGPVSLNLVKDDPEYMSIRKSFLIMHMFCSFVNLSCYGACGVNIWCLANQLSL